jgi:hypothetical protein
MKLNIRKPVLSSLLIAAATTVLFVASCSEDDDTVVVNPPSIDSDSPATGIWTGTITSVSPNNPQDYDMTLVMFMPPGSGEGGAMAIVYDPDTGEGVRLLDGGFVLGEDSKSVQDACPDPAYQDLVVGTGGYPIREFNFITHSAGGESKTAKYCFALNGNTLTGTVNIDDLGAFTAELVYSTDNSINSDHETIGEKVWVDSKYYWSRDTSNLPLTVVGTKQAFGTALIPGMKTTIRSIDGAITFEAKDTDTSSCGSYVDKNSGERQPAIITDVVDHNIFIIGPFPERNALSDSVILVDRSCDPDVDDNLVGHTYNGMGFITRDADGQEIFVTVITSFGLYNWPPLFVIDEVTGLCVIDPATWVIDPATWVIDPDRLIDPDSDQCVIDADTGECLGLCEIDPATGQCAGDCEIDPVTLECTGECLADDPEALSPSKALYNVFEVEVAE